jgi:hypothetical protein
VPLDIAKTTPENSSAVIIRLIAARATTECADGSFQLPRCASPGAASPALTEGLVFRATGARPRISDISMAEILMAMSSGSLRIIMSSGASDALPD